MSGDSLGDRMKRYEAASRGCLVRRMPAIVRVDGKAFHTLTRKMERPFDDAFASAMRDVALALCETIQGAKLAYVQSDEVSVMVCDFDRHETEAWFDYEIQKMVSVAAGIATSAFLQAAWQRRIDLSAQVYPTFDARAFNVPREDVCNYFVWRQQDAVRNSIQMVGRAHFSHRELDRVNTKEIVTRLETEKGVHWALLPTWQRRGACVTRIPGEIRPRWDVDKEIPEFTKQRNYIEARMITVEPQP